jgi:hypothetical protein
VPQGLFKHELAWEFDVGITAFLVATDTDIHKLVAKLGEFTRDREPREARHMQLRTLFSSHYDAPRIQFSLHFFLEDSATANLNKSEAIKLLVEKCSLSLGLFCRSTSFKVLQK